MGQPTVVFMKFFFRYVDPKNLSIRLSYSTLILQLKVNLIGTRCWEEVSTMLPCLFISTLGV